MTSTVEVRHNFETAHRLPHLAGKCVSLHGHSWWVSVRVTGPKLDDGTVVEFGPLKSAIRYWVDGHLDHGTMLGRGDELIGPLRRAGCKVFVFDEHQEALGLPWPTVENVAQLLGQVSQRLLDKMHPGGLHRVDLVTVRETHVNQATWSPDD